MGATTLQGRASEYFLESDEPAFLGRLAVLYRATATADGREVILKVFREETAEAGAVASFYAELDALRTLAHPHVPIQHAMPLLRQVAVAIDYAHSRGVIHGEIEPENILLTEDRQTSL